MYRHSHNPCPAASYHAAQGLFLSTAHDPSLKTYPTVLSFVPMSTQSGKLDAHAAAEARRQKILASRGSRLAKLTNTARGAEGGGVFNNDAPLGAFNSPNARRDFLGDDEPLLPPPPVNRLASRATAAIPPPSQRSSQIPPFDAAALNALGRPVGPAYSEPTISQDPFMTMMQAMASGNAPNAGITQQADLTSESPSRVSQWLPFVHGLSILLTVLYAAAVLEPNAWKNSAGSWESGSSNTVLYRWKSLVSGRNTSMDLQTVPVFPIFVALQLALHSLRLILEHNVPPPPGLITSILPYLPPRFQLYVVGGMKYLTIGQQFLDDLGLMIFVLGAMVWVANL
ncbi:hypothetical protein CALVIDRAFT_534095 [Calocera viscosa TUFC12733]|uniref:Uncharacterized protein n=1 Tax=Calocera viscosa (strain TUFC12733) TaxID=1330018 RepID=A0A167QE06_CALVF|nr:hypothetical protein CALVIDRAFT_534095 [Calocera viscosa TUFC12733]